MFAGLFLAFLFAQDGEGTLKPLVDVALRNNPEILAAQKKLEAARQRPAQARSLPDPMFSAGYASNGGPLPGQGLGKEPTSNIGFMVSQQLPAAGKRDLRGQIALKEASMAEQEYWQVQLSVVSRIKRAWHMLHHDYAQIDIIQRNRTLLERVLKATELRYSVGKAAQQDLLKAQTQISLLEAKTTRLEQDLHSREAEINSLLARDLTAAIPRPKEIPAEESLVTLGQLADQAKAWSPALLKEQRSVERTELALNLAKKDGALDYTVSAGYFNMGSMPAMYQAKVDFNLPFFTRDRQRAAVTEQAQSLDAARRTYQATGNTLLFRIKDDYLLSGSSWRIMRLYSTTLIPQATLTLESSMISYETGQVDFLTVLNNLMGLFEYESGYHEEMLMYHLALIRLEESTGLTLVKED